MHRLAALTLIIVILLMLGFATWKLFCGQFEAAFSVLPFLVIIFLFVSSRRPQPGHSQE